MPFCPKCRYEFNPDALLCPDCNQSLVDELPVKTVTAEVPDDSWVVIGSVGNKMKSDMVKGSLDSNNIPSMVLSSSFSGRNGWSAVVSEMASSPKHGNVIMVPREFEMEASLVLESVLGEDFKQPNQR